MITNLGSSAVFLPFFPELTGLVLAVGGPSTATTATDVMSSSRDHSPASDTKAAPMAQPEAEDTEYDRTESLDQTEASLAACDAVDDDEKVVINVGGSRHEILLSTLASKPGTRLSYLTKRHKRGRGEEYFFDRHPGVFNTVMDYYRSGRVLNPDRLMVCYLCLSARSNHRKTVVRSVGVLEDVLISQNGFRTIPKCCFSLFL